MAEHNTGSAGRDLTAVRDERAVRVGLSGTGSGIGRADGHTGRCVTYWRAAWLPLGGRAAAGVPARMDPGHRWADRTLLGPEAGQGSGTGVNDRVRVRAELVARFTSVIPAQAPGRATVMAASPTCRK
jgi:hypothetical protein